MQVIAEGIETDAPEIVALARQEAGRKRDPVFKAKALYSVTNRALTYDAKAGRVSALAALRRGKASCEGYARLFAALCRASGIPARLVYGLRVRAESLNSGQIVVDRMRHVWDEVYLAGIGWVPVDPTFTYTVNGRKDVTYDYFGRLGQEGDLHIIIGREEQSIIWDFRVPPGHPGLVVEHHLYLSATR